MSFEEIMRDEDIRLSFEGLADKKELDCSIDFFDQRDNPNPYIDSDTAICYEIFCKGVENERTTAKTTTPASNAGSTLNAETRREI